MFTNRRIKKLKEQIIDMDKSFETREKNLITALNCKDSEINILKAKLDFAKKEKEQQKKIADNLYEQLNGKKPKRGRPRKESKSVEKS